MTCNNDNEPLKNKQLRNHVDFLPEMLFFTTTHDFSLGFLELVLFKRQFVRSIIDPIYPYCQYWPYFQKKRSILFSLQNFRQPVAIINLPLTEVIILPTRTMQCYKAKGKSLKICHRFVLFDSPKMGHICNTVIPSWKLPYPRVKVLLSR